MNSLMPINISDATLSEMSSNIETALNMINNAAVYHTDRRITLLNKYRDLQKAIRLIYDNAKLIEDPNFINKNIIWMIQK